MPAWCAKADAAAVGSPSAQAVQLDVGALVRTWIERLFADALPCALARALARSRARSVARSGVGAAYAALVRARVCVSVSVCECL